MRRSLVVLALTVSLLAFSTTSNAWKILYFQDFEDFGVGDKIVGSADGWHPHSNGTAGHLISNDKPPSSLPRLDSREGRKILVSSKSGGDAEYSRVVLGELKVNIPPTENCGGIGVYYAQDKVSDCNLNLTLAQDAPWTNCVYWGISLKYYGTDKNYGAQNTQTKEMFDSKIPVRFKEWVTFAWAIDKNEANFYVQDATGKLQSYVRVDGMSLAADSQFWIQTHGPPPPHVYYDNLFIADTANIEEVFDSLGKIMGRAV